MPKMKTHSSAKKRFKVTGSGKIKRFQATNVYFGALGYLIDWAFTFPPSPALERLFLDCIRRVNSLNMVSL